MLRDPKPKPKPKPKPEPKPKPNPNPTPTPNPNSNPNEVTGALTVQSRFRGNRERELTEAYFNRVA